MACLTVAACHDDPKEGPPTGPTKSASTVVIRGAVLDWSNAPLAGAQVTGTAGTQATQMTGADGRFDLGSFDATIRQVRIDIIKAGFVPQATHIAINSSVIDTVIKLRPMEPLPLDGTITRDLLPSDPSDYVGEAYESDYSWNTRYYVFTAQSDEVVVDLDWDHAATPTLKMWAMAGALVSKAEGTHEVLSLPRGQSGILLVSKPYDGGALTRAVRFTLTVR